MIIVGVNNTSTVVNSHQVNQMIEACNLWLPMVAQAWGRTCPYVVLAKTGNWVVNIVNEEKDVPGALAYHDEEHDVIHIYVLAKTILDYGGVVLYKDAHTPTVSGALSHELGESLVDGFCNGWWQASESVAYASEICDPVQDNNIIMRIRDGTKVAMSDFILPAWMDTEAVKGPFNYLNTLKRPFSLSPGGYVSYMDLTTGQVNQIFDDLMPQWLQTQKKTSLRNVIRRRHKKAQPALVDKPASPVKPVSPIPIKPIPQLNLAKLGEEIKDHLPKGEEE